MLEKRNSLEITALGLNVGRVKELVDGASKELKINSIKIAK
jgi:hypothetical protein